MEGGDGGWMEGEGGDEGREGRYALHYIALQDTATVHTYLGSGVATVCK